MDVNVKLRIRHASSVQTKNNKFTQHADFAEGIRGVELFRVQEDLEEVQRFAWPIRECEFDTDRR